MLPDFRGDLFIRHLVRGLDFFDPCAELFFSQPLLQLVLRLSGAEYQDRLGVLDMGDYGIIIGIQMPR